MVSHCKRLTEKTAQQMNLRSCGSCNVSQRVCIASVTRARLKASWSSNRRSRVRFLPLTPRQQLNQTEQGIRHVRAESSSFSCVTNRYAFCSFINVFSDRRDGQCRSTQSHLAERIPIEKPVTSSITVFLISKKFCGFESRCRYQELNIKNTIETL